MCYIVFLSIFLFVCLIFYLSCVILTFFFCLHFFFLVHQLWSCQFVSQICIFNRFVLYYIVLLSIFLFVCLNFRHAVCLVSFLLLSVYLHFFHQLWSFVSLSVKIVSLSVVTYHIVHAHHSTRLSRGRADGRLHTGPPEGHPRRTYV